MKTNEELNALRAEIEVINNQLRELSEDELTQVFGGYERAMTVSELLGLNFQFKFPRTGIQPCNFEPNSAPDSQPDQKFIPEIDPHNRFHNNTKEE